VIAPGLVTDVQIISIGDDQWETNYITGDWQVSIHATPSIPCACLTPERHSRNPDR